MCMRWYSFVLKFQRWDIWNFKKGMGYHYVTVLIVSLVNFYCILTQWVSCAIALRYFQFDIFFNSLCQFNPPPLPPTHTPLSESCFWHVNICLFIVILKPIKWCISQNDIELITWCDINPLKYTQVVMMVFHTFLTKLKVKVAINRYEYSPIVNGFWINFT